MYPARFSQVCPVRADFERDSQQAACQVKRMKLNPITNSLPVKKVKFPCAEPGCEKEYTNKTCLADHHRRAHGAEKLKCEEIDCSASFFARRAIRQHMWVKHGIGKGPQCDECGKKVIDVEYLRNHQRAAHGAPKLLCSEPGCAETFTYIQGRSSHIAKASQTKCTLKYKKKDITEVIYYSSYICTNSQCN